MGRYTYQKRPGQPDAAPRQAARPNLAQAVPNSAALDMLDHVQERPQAQIPAAEAEADRLSASVTSGGPEAVKAAMGRRLGADFSGIRFHMGGPGRGQGGGHERPGLYLRRRHLLWRGRL